MASFVLPALSVGLLVAMPEGLRRMAKPAATDQLEPLEAAYIAGGERRFVRTALYTLFVSGAATIGEEGDTIVVDPARAVTPLPSSLQSLSAGEIPAQYSSMRSYFQASVLDIERTLGRRSYILGAGQRHAILLFQLVIFGFAAYSVTVLHRQNWIWVVLIAVFFLDRASSIATTGGRRAIDALRNRYGDFLNMGDKGKLYSVALGGNPFNKGDVGLATAVTGGALIIETDIVDAVGVIIDAIADSGDGGQSGDGDGADGADGGGGDGGD
jgi:uncharacterized protein (TIGR04222 family)